MAGEIMVNFNSAKMQVRQAKLPENLINFA
jgi:hypothetical protein